MKRNSFRNKLRLRRIAEGLTEARVQYRLFATPLPLPLLNDANVLKLILGVCLCFGGVLVFSIWKERLFSLKDEERAKFLMFNIIGGSWLVAVFAVCGGIYFLCDSLLKFHV